MTKSKKMPKVVILAGGMGMRLKEETEYKPKPMVNIGHYPILWHIMKIYMHYGFNEFIICLGYKGEMIKDYFLNYEYMNSDFTLDYSDKCKIQTHKSNSDDKFKVTLVDTGLETMTGGRLKRIEKFIDGDNFLLTYGDGVANIDIKALYDFHMKHKHLATVTAVHPESRFGELTIKDDSVIAFSEKPQLTEGLINGGFLVLNKKFFRYLDAYKDCFFEQEPIHKVTEEGQLKAYVHRKFWQCMDTQKDVQYLNGLWSQKKAPWKVWQ